MFDELKKILEAAKDFQAMADELKRNVAEIREQQNRIEQNQIQILERLK